MLINILSFRKTSVLVILLLFVPVFLNAQVTPAAEIEILLNTNAVTYAQAARFVLEAAEVLAVDDPQAAFAYALQNGWLPKSVTADSPAQLNHISLLLMRSFGLKGGLMFSAFNNSRYAYRDLVYMNVIIGRVDATMPVTGERLIFYVTRLLNRPDVSIVLEARSLAGEN